MNKHLPEDWKISELLAASKDKPAVDPLTQHISNEIDIVTKQRDKLVAFLKINAQYWKDYRQTVNFYNDQITRLNSYLTGDSHGSTHYKQINKMHKAILINPQNKAIYEVQVGDGIEDVYKFIGCDCFTCVALKDNYSEVLYLDDNGFLYPNHYFFIEGYPKELAGKALILGGNEEGETISTNYTVEEIRQKVTFSPF